MIVGDFLRIPMFDIFRWAVKPYSLTERLVAIPTADIMRRCCTETDTAPESINHPFAIISVSPLYLTMNFQWNTPAILSLTMTSHTYYKITTLMS